MEEKKPIGLVVPPAVLGVILAHLGDLVRAEIPVQIHLLEERPTGNQVMMIGSMQGVMDIIDRLGGEFFEG